MHAIFCQNMNWLVGFSVPNSYLKGYKKMCPWLLYEERQHWKACLTLFFFTFFVFPVLFSCSHVPFFDISCFGCLWVQWYFFLFLCMCVIFCFVGSSKLCLLAHTYELAHLLFVLVHVCHFLFCWKLVMSSSTSSSMI